MHPLFKQLDCDTETPVSLYLKLAQKHDYAFLLESAETSQSSGRYSFIGFNPLFLHIFPADGAQNPLKILEKAYKEIEYAPDPDLPRFQAGFVGYFSYEIARHFEKLDLPTKGSRIPEGIFFFPKNLLIFDHFKHNLTAIAYSEKDLEKLMKKISLCHSEFISESHSVLRNTVRFRNILKQVQDDNDFEHLVAAAKEHICAGEVFQIVLSQEFRQKTGSAPFDLYRRLRSLSPSPYMYYLQYPDFSIIGSSPETLVQVENNEIILRPIAGTRRRGKTEEEDASLAEELKNDEKEQAEHMMLVDLGRNDVSNAAKPGSVRATRLMEVEKFSHVMHLVSEIRGEKAADKSMFDVFKTAFPAGTLTGAPKIRAMELIAQFEKCPREIYGGAVGYFDMTGNMDFAIAIRTMLYHNKTVFLRAGAGIVYDSKPDFENQECFNKARGPLAALI